MYLFTEALSAGWSSASQAPLSGTEYQYLGEDVALSADGNTIVLGRPVLTQNTSHTFSSPDGAIVLTEAPGGNWSQTATITGVVPSGTGFSVSTQAAVSGDGQTVAIAGVGASAEAFPPVPTVISPPTVSGNPVQGDSVTEVNGTWSGNPTGYSYQWAECDSTGQNCLPIPWAVDQPYTLTSSDVGSTIAVQETATNISGDGTPATSLPEVVQPLAATSAPDVSGHPLQGQVLTETHGSWNTTVTGYLYQWEDCDSTGHNCSAIHNATGQSYTLTNADAGHTIEIEETAFNDGGLGIAATSKPTAVVTPLVPASAAGR